MMDVRQQADLKGEIYSVYVTQVIAESRTCPQHDQKVEIYYVGHKPQVRGCCRAFEEEIEELIRFGR